ncbi:MAG: aspartate aminotransferase family protein [Planctomycetota bacterium]
MGKSKSAALYERALKVLPGGVSRNTVLRTPYPLYAVSGQGCRVLDEEGVERIDFSNNMASLLHGHAHPEIVGAVTEQLAKGTAFTLATEVEIEFAEYLTSRSPSFEKLRFVNSGTEAVMGAVRAARAFTSRPKIAKVEGAYHGQYDYAEVSQTAAPENWGSVDHPVSVPVVHGTPESALADVIVIPFNDPERALSILDEHRGEIACVLLDLMPHRVGLRPGNPVFIAAIREWTTQDGALLVLDEVVTFRSEFAGAQSWFDIKPDLTALGKAIGGGFPVGAIAGRSEVMDVMNPLADKVLFPHSGTFSANPITMTAGLTAMRLFDQAAVAKVNALADRAKAGIREAIASTGVEACVTGEGSMFRLHLKANPPLNYRETYAAPEEAKQLKVLLDHLFDEGLIMINTCSAAISTAMTNREIDHLITATHSGLQKLPAIRRQCAGKAQSRRTK